MSRLVGRLAAIGGGLIGFVLIFAFVGVIGSCLITLAIWPGELKLLAPILCSDAQPDAFVVADTSNPRPGETATNFTMYCVGPRGDATDVGFMKPFLMISVVNGAVIMLPFVLIAIGLRATLGSPIERLRPQARGNSRVEVRRDALGADPAVDTDVADHGDHDDASRTSRESRTGRGPPSGSTAGPFVD